MLFPTLFLFVHILEYFWVHCYVNISATSVNIAVIYSNCDGDENSHKQETSKWIVDRLNFLGYFKSMNVELTAYKNCKQEDFVESVFDVWRKSTNIHTLGIITEPQVPEVVAKLSESLNLNLKYASSESNYLVRSTIRLLEALRWTDNVTAILSDEELVDELFEFAKSRKICIRKYLTFKENASYDYDENDESLIVFGDHKQITDFLNKNDHLLDLQMVITPTDGQPIIDISENAFIILPSYIPLTDSREKMNLLPVQQIFELAHPIISYTEYLRTFLNIHCNNTRQGFVCLQNTRFSFFVKDSPYTDEMLMKILKIEPLRNNFLYEVYKVENESDEFFKLGYNFKQHLQKMFSYNIFDDNLASLYDLPMMNSSWLCDEDLESCRSSCMNFKGMKENINVFMDGSIEFRTDPFVLVFIAISAVGILVNLIILTFLFICICRREVLEGNPATTILLLITVLLMYCSVLPFGIKKNNDNENVLCLLKSLWTTLSIAGSFSLILGRCILLATVTREIAYMSHIPGSVQAFLTLFIFGIQAALSIQVLDDCQGMYKGSTFLYLISYNVLLLLMILCICSMIFKSQRNYKEGKYFFISAILISICWCFWISCYKVLNASWRDPLICFATVSTAIIFQGIILVSRTYLMLVSSVRHKMRNNLPNMNERNGVLDIYRQDARQVYDCVNVAAINAISVASAGITTTDLDEDIYNYPTLPRGEELNFEVQTNSSMQLDKMTRF